MNSTLQHILYGSLSGFSLGLGCATLHGVILGTGLGATSGILVFLIRNNLKAHKDSPVATHRILNYIENFHQKLSATKLQRFILTGAAFGLFFGIGRGSLLAIIFAALIGAGIGCFLANRAIRPQE